MTELTLTYRNQTIHIDREQSLVSLTDCWRAAGSPPELRPTLWRRQPGPQELVKYVEKNLSVLHTGNPGAKSTQVLTSKVGGNDSGTWAHWHIALAYVQDLSPAFRTWAGEQLQQVFSSEPAGTLPGVHLVEGAGQLERHLKRLHTQGYLKGTEAIDILSAALEKIWGIALPRCVGTEPRKPGSRPNKTSGLAGQVLPPPEPPIVEAVPEPEPGQKTVTLAVGEGETAFRASELPPNTYTGNGAAFQLDKLDNGIFTHWLHHKRRSEPDVVYPRDSYGREFNALARELGFHPLAAKGYTPPPDGVINEKALKVEAPAARTGEKGTVGVGTRTTAVFTEAGLWFVLNKIRQHFKLHPYSWLEFTSLTPSPTPEEQALSTENPYT